MISIPPLVIEDIVRHNQYQQLQILRHCPPPPPLPPTTATRTPPSLPVIAELRNHQYHNRQQ